jgi:ribose 5-phosphate isomerase B
MRVALGADHAGVQLKDAVRSLLESKGIEVQDVGTSGESSVDYPDYAATVGQAVAGGQVELGILVCGTGLGMAIAANKIAGVRAAAVVDVESARLAREHNDANILALGARVTPADVALKIVDTFLGTPFAGGRHQRRLDKITAIENGRSRP